VATLLHHTLDISKRARESEERMRQLVIACEIAGVIVIRSSTVGSNTSRSLDVDEFRGFALSDPLAPLVFINTADAPAAQPFTLLHELAHLTLGESGVSNMPLAETPNGARDVEMFCNRVAAEFLVPQREFRAVWRSSADFAATAKALAKQFGVSPMVIARRAHELGLVSADVYWPFVNHQLELARRRRDAQRDSEGGPAFLTLARARNGSLFTQVVVGAAQAGEMLYRDAAALLGVQPKHIDELG
jgi:Zn-dependent peptidase ImmA (M78 family)